MTNVGDIGSYAMTSETENLSHDTGAVDATINSKTVKTTPPRHNYHNTNTPIASIKRPRSSLVGRTQGRNNDSTNINDAPATPMSVMPLDDSDSVLYTPPGESAVMVDSLEALQTIASPMPSVPSAHRRSLLPLPTDSTLSPMHGIRPVTSRDLRDIPSIAIALDDNETESNASSWVGKKVDALFSPVYHFLHHEELEQKNRDRKYEEEKHQGIQVKESLMHRSMVGSPESPNEDSDGDTRMEISSTPEKNVDDLETQPTSSVSSSSAEGIEVLYSKDGDAVPNASGYDVEVEDDEASSFDSKDKERLNGSYHDGSLDADQQANRHRMQLNTICGENSDSEDDDHSMERPDHPTDLDEFNPWHFIKSLPPYARIAHTVPPVSLPPKAVDAPEKTLVLDLDETLVHCTVETPETPSDLTFPVVFRGTTFTVHVRLRPFLKTFLDRLVGKYEIVVFTASQKVYANELLNLIDPKGVYIQHRLFRESCLTVDGNFLKDLNVLGRDLSQTILVDNSPHAFGYQIDNGIPIESWFDNNDDRELLKLEKFLRSSIYPARDVRPVVREKFQSYRLIEETSMPTSPNSAALQSSSYS